MSATLINGRAIAKKIHAQTAQAVEELKKRGVTPKLAVVLVGDDKPSQTYVQVKARAAKKVGMNFELHELPANISREDIVTRLLEIQKDPSLTGLIVQLPLPEPLYTTEVLNAIEPRFDVDCLTDANLGKLVMQTNHIAPPTPGAVMAILEDLDVDLVGKHVTIIGMGALVGKPLAIMLANKRASVTTCNSATKHITEKCLDADILISAVGKKDLVTADMVKPGAIVIDAGVDFENNQMFGDVDVAGVSEKASHVTPTPGGVGPLTVAKLLHNVVVCADLM